MRGWGLQGIPCGMAASTGMIKEKKPLEIIWNNYSSNVSSKFFFSSYF
jgi:hypothetical protein